MSPAQTTQTPPATPRRPGHNEPRHGTRKRREKGCGCWPCEVAARVREERRRLIREGVV